MAHGYLRLVDDIPQEVTIDELRQEYPNTMFMSDPPAGALDHLGVYRYEFESEEQKPTDFDKRTQHIKAGAYYQDDDGNWKRGWWIYTKTDDEIQDYYDQLCVDVRLERDELLKETDWWAVSDRTMTAEQIAYRQALRDITTQTDFPYEVTWPTKP